ncbi:ATP-binding cassette domain-containing protein (plasmid) [Thioclava litoralis]|uniref:ATP-binding cassette domain-containing protein n=1 Tax=Thioclava litoralis TaxID=3076557 RepID=A0ABZ1E6Z9_9RHOB|nr:ATP-binding cassette domain-containing protein [Thioclava sp. FTW29]
MREGPAMTHDTLLQARGLGISFGGVDAVGAVDFDLRPRELRCLIGPNGAGKTTFFRLLSGQYAPSRGTIRFDGQPLQGLRPFEIARRGIGVKTQVPSLFEGLSLRANIELAASRRLRGAELAAEVEAVLHRIGLYELRETPCAELAHGQRQWVELGQILASRPKLALLDEPAAGMTHDESLRTVALIRQITRESAVIVVEHDMEFIRLLGAEVTVFERGRIIAQGSFAQVARDPQVRAAYLGRKEQADA